MSEKEPYLTLKSGGKPVVIHVNGVQLTFNANGKLTVMSDKAVEVLQPPEPLLPGQAQSGFEIGDVSANGYVYAGVYNRKHDGEAIPLWVSTKAHPPCSYAEAYKLSALDNFPTPQEISVVYNRLAKPASSKEVIRYKNYWALENSYEENNSFEYSISTVPSHGQGCLENRSVGIHERDVSTAALVTVLRDAWQPVLAQGQKLRIGARTRDGWVYAACDEDRQDAIWVSPQDLTCPQGIFKRQCAEMTLSQASQTASRVAESDGASALPNEWQMEKIADADLWHGAGLNLRRDVPYWTSLGRTSIGREHTVVIVQQHHHITDRQPYDKKAYARAVRVVPL
jgi:hypothetical protein